MAAQPSYPVHFEVDYPDRELNRLTTLFRVITIIPIAIILGMLVSGGSRDRSGDFSPAAVGVIFVPIALMIVFRRKYPRWWFDWNVAVTAFASRVVSYGMLLRDEYPSTDEEQAVHLSIPYPNVVTELDRWKPLYKWFLAIPHLIALFFLWIAAFVCMLVAWVAILVTGRYPRALFDFIVGVERWALRVDAYAFMLVTDQYPPFRLGD